MTNVERISQEEIELNNIKKDDEEYYLDAFGNRVSYNGLKVLKKEGTKLNLSEFHVNEIMKCSESFYYFIYNYCKIMKKKGIGTPDIREFQQRFMNDLLTENRIVATIGRQMSKTTTASLYILWKAIFSQNENYGIAANNSKLAREILHKIKQIFLSLPIWLQQGIRVWNKSSVEFENGVRILTDATSGDSFRGFSIKILFVDECVSYKEIITVRDDETGEIFELPIGDFYNRLKETNINIKSTKSYSVLTKNGFQKFSGIKKTNHTKSLKFFFSDNSNIEVSYKHLFMIEDNLFQEAYKFKINDKIDGKVISKIEKNTNNIDMFDLLNVENGSHYITSDVTSHNCAFISPNIWAEFEDSVFPTVTSFDDAQIVLVSTPNGMNHFYHFYEGAKNNTNGYKLFTADWWELEGRDEAWKEKIIKENGSIYFAQNFGAEFLGSSYTLLSGDTLKQLKSKPHISEEILDGFLVYEQPIEEHTYIVAVDPNKGGDDAFSVQVIDVTSLPFKQVASANLYVDYFRMPKYLEKIGKLYNYGYIIIENNIGSGQSVADQLSMMGYPNLYKDKGKKFYGFNNNQKTRKNILSLMNLFIETKNLEIFDLETINQFHVFIKKNGKYQADNGQHDDLILALAIAFAPFQNFKNFSDLDTLIKILENEMNEDEKKNTSEIISFGNFNIPEYEPGYIHDPFKIQYIGFEETKMFGYD